MINTSQLFSSKIAESTRQFSARLKYGTKEISGAIRSVQITSGACSEGNFTVGSVFSSYIEVVIDECKDTFEDKELLLQIGLLVDGETTEYIDIGYYTVTNPKTSVYSKDFTSTAFTAVGRITSKLNKVFNVPTVLTLRNLASAIKTQTGVNIIFNGEVSDAVLTKDITGMTCKEVLSVMAGTFGGFATEDEKGNIVVSKYATNSKISVDGDRMTALPEFNDYDYELYGVKVVVSAEGQDEDGNVIEEVAFTEGTPRLTMTNEFMTEALFESFVANTVGYKYRPGTVPLALGDPRLQPWDCLEVTDVKGNVHIVPCLNIVHTFDGGLTTTIMAPGESETEASSSVAGPISHQLERIYSSLITAQEAILKRLKAEEILADDITGATGNFTKYLTGVKIIGDLIEAGTLKTDRLIIKGTDGKYYALNTDFTGLPNVEPVEEETIHGSVLVKESVTADRINVTDLFAKDIEATGSVSGMTFISEGVGPDGPVRMTLDAATLRMIEQNANTINDLFVQAHHSEYLTKFIPEKLEIQVFLKGNAIRQTISNLETGEVITIFKTEPHANDNKGKVTLCQTDVNGDLNVDGSLIVGGVNIADIVGPGSGGGGGTGGASPTIDVSKANGVTTITITAVNGVKIAKINDGTSPTISVTEITGGHRVSITDINGTKHFDVKDGESGSGGATYDEETGNLTI